VDLYPRDHPNQPHHAGAVLIFGPDGEVVAHAQTERIRDEMVVTTLEAAAVAHERSQPNYTLRTRRPELFGELARDQVDA
jgi:predicted amidohydrolase